MLNIYFPFINIERLLKQRKGLGSMNDYKIIDLYRERSENAIAETEKNTVDIVII